ncbi:MAG: hypothetical protein RL186_288 [Pseudomonadota bacterium]
MPSCQPISREKGICCPLRFLSPDATFRPQFFGASAVLCSKSCTKDVAKLQIVRNTVSNSSAAAGYGHKNAGIEESLEAMIVNMIDAQRSRLRPSERAVADFVLGRPSVVVHMSIADFAQSAGVSEPTIMRFCKALGCVGFMEFKLALARDLERRAMHMIPTGQSGAGAGGHGQDLVAQTISQVEAQARSFDLADLGQIVEWCTNARSIIVCHGGSEAGLATQMADALRATRSGSLTHRQMVCASLDSLADHLGGASSEVLPQQSVILALRSCAEDTGFEALKDQNQGHKWVTIGFGAPWADAALALGEGARAPVSATSLSADIAYLCVCEALCLGVRAHLGMGSQAGAHTGSSLLQSRREIAYGNARRKDRQAADQRRSAPRGPAHKEFA